MKKLVVVPLLLCLAGVAFAFDLSAGIGGTVGGFWQTEYYEDYLFIYDELRIRGATVPYGFSAWFDATYGTVAIGFRANGNTHTLETSEGPLDLDPVESDDNCSSGFLSFALLGRYPFALGPISLFPLLGIEYDLILYYKDGSGADLDTTGLSQFWFKTGVGADFVLYKGLFVRPLLLLGFKVLNKAEQDKIETALTTGVDPANVARKTDFVFEGGVQAGWRF